MTTVNREAQPGTDTSGGRTQPALPPAPPPEALIARRVWALLLALLVGSILAAVALAEESNASFTSATAALTFAGALAVALERTLEVFWSVLGSTRAGAWWPLRQVKAAFADLETHTKDLLAAPIAEVKKALESARAAAGDAPHTVRAITAELDRIDRLSTDFTQRLADAGRLAPGSSRLALVTAVAREADEALTEASAVALDAGATVTKVAGQLSDAAERAISIATAFTDNPARRIASILIGASLGLLAAGAMSLNLVAAALGLSAQSTDPLRGDLGIVLTGLVLGLGANPTHEVIKALQQYKERTKRPEVLARPGTDGLPDSGAMRGIVDRNLLGYGTFTGDPRHRRTRAGWIRSTD